MSVKYLGTPLSGTRADVRATLHGRHALIPYFRQDDLQAALKVCQSVVFDNSAYSIYQQGQSNYDAHYAGYVEWVRQYKNHPRFAWALIPDAIADDDPWLNERYLRQWPDDLRSIGVPVYHMQEPPVRLRILCRLYERVAIAPGAYQGDLHLRLEECMAQACENGQPMAKLHGLKLQDPKLFTAFPFASTDSTNVARNTYRALKQGKASTVAGAADFLASRIEAHNSSGKWHPKGNQIMLDLTT